MSLQDELSVKPEFCFPGLGRKPDISRKCLTNPLELRSEAALALGRLQLLGKVSKISKAVLRWFLMRSFPGAQLKESHGGGVPSWDGIQELLDAPAGLDEVQEPEASPLTELLVWADTRIPRLLWKLPSVEEWKMQCLGKVVSLGFFGVEISTGFVGKARKEELCIVRGACGAPAVVPSAGVGKGLTGLCSADAGFGTTSGGAFGTSAFGSNNNTGGLFGSTQTKPGTAPVEGNGGMLIKKAGGARKVIFC